jgi:hypothetical protein
MNAHENNPDNPHFFGLDRFIPFFGVVEDRNDPLCLGRCKIRIFGVHPDDKELVSTDQLPWAFPVMPIIGNSALGGAGHSAVGPVVGTNVVGFFADGYDRQQPFFFGVIAGGSGQFASGADQSNPNLGQDGTSAYGPQGDSQQVSPTPNNLDPKKPVYQKGAEIAALIVARFAAQGIKQHHAVAILGNLIHESGARLEVRREAGKGDKNTPPGKNSAGIGWGIAQWTNTKSGHGRLEDFYNWAARNGKDIKNYNHNVEFLIYELQTSFNKMIKVFGSGSKSASAPAFPKGPHDTTTLKGAVDYCCGYYERPKAKYAALQSRLNHADCTLQAMNKSGAPVRSTGKPK